VAGEDLVNPPSREELINPCSDFHRSVHKAVDRLVDKTCKPPVVNPFYHIAQRLGSRLYLNNIQYLRLYHRYYMLIRQVMTQFINKYYHRGKFFLALSLIPAMILPAATACSSALSVDELAAKIQTAYDHTKDFKANFIQEATIRSVDRTTREEGTVYLKKPARMLWDYTKPSMKKLIINPSKAWLYIPDDNIVYLQDAKKVLSSRMTIRFLTGIGRLKDDFETTFPSSGPMDKKGNYIMALTPRKYEAGIKTLLITVDKDSYRIIECAFTDMYDNTTRLIFSNIRFNSNPPDKLFDFIPPTGVEIYDIKGQQP